MSACVLWTGARTPKGYGVVRFDGRTVYAHRLAFYKIHGRWPKVCRHTCDTPACVNTEHLLDGTQSDNLLDCVARGRKNAARGERSGQRRLTLQQVHEIRAALPHVAKAELARRYAVSPTTIRGIATGRLWRGL